MLRISSTLSNQDPGTQHKYQVFVMSGMSSLRGLYLNLHHSHVH